MRIVAPTAPTGFTLNYPLSQTQAFSVLASQRYRLMSPGPGIEFDPADPLYYYVSQSMKDELAFAQTDPGVAQFLTDGLKFAYSNTDGQLFPSIRAVGALANFKGSGPQTVHISDPTTNGIDSHVVTVTSSASCGASTVNFAETVTNTSYFSPLFGDSIHLWTGTVPAGFKGGNHIPSTPFNGPVSSGNPYLVIAVDGSAMNWTSYSFKTENCFNNPGYKCSGTLTLDPYAYSEPGDQYDPTGALLGMQANPFPIDGTTLYADPSHAGQWATRIINGTQEWGTFSKPVVLGSSTKYRYVKQY